MIRAAWSRIFGSPVYPLLCLFAFLIALPGAFAQSRHNDWDVEKEVPKIQILGEVSEIDRKAAEVMNRHLVDTLSYWKERGLSDPPNLEGIYYIPQWRGLQVVEVLRIMNPTIPDIQAHVKAQWEHLNKSLFAQILREHHIAMGIGNPELALKQMFDNYASARYGLELESFHKHVEDNSLITDTSVGNPIGGQYDNAYYARHPRLDIEEIFIPAQSGPTDLERDLPRAVDQEAMARALNSENGTSRRLVILPRLMQVSGDAFGTILDPDVINHELGHHIVSTISAEEMELSLNEAMADYIAAVAAKDPEIGEFFVQVSAEIARRIRERGNPTPRERAIADAMARLAEKEFLRDMSKLVTIDDLSRNPPEEAHTAANPVRWFLWSLREAVGEDPRFDTVVLSSLHNFTLLPMLLSRNSQKLVQVRQLWANIRNSIGRISLKNKNGSKGVETRQGLVALDRFFMELELHNFFAEDRPAILPDYVLPEFFRNFYRTVQREVPEWTELVRLKAGIAMNSEAAMAFPVSNGVEEIAFFRTAINTANPVTRNKVAAILKELSELRRKFERLAEGSFEVDINPLMSEAEVTRVLMSLNTQEGVQAYVENLASAYESNLEKLQEFERTGSSLRLYLAHPVFKPAMAAFETVFSFAMKRIKARQESRTITESILSADWEHCQDQLSP